MIRQLLIHWLLNYPDPAYDSMKARLWLHQPIGLWNRLRVRTARWLMNEGE